MNSHLYASVLNIFYGKSLTLGTWELVDAVQLDKNNGETWDPGTWLLMMLDCMGKCYYWLMHQHIWDNKSHFGYGFYEHRRREQAILVHHVVAGQLLEVATAARMSDESKLSYVSTFRGASPLLFRL